MPNERTYLSQPLVTSIYTADPSAHIFAGRIHVYTTHDIDAPPLSNSPPFTDASGNMFATRDYHVLTMDHVGGPVTVHPRALDINDVPWAARQLWAPDAAEKDGTYYLYFPAKDHQGVFRIGVATSHDPVGPFVAQPKPIAGSYSIDPAVFTDDDGESYLYFGGIGPGQLHSIHDGDYRPSAVTEDTKDAEVQAFMPRVARLSHNMFEFAEPPSEVLIIDENGAPLKRNDNARRFFESAWLHKYAGRYYLSYSSGDTHFIAYAIGDSPYGPFTYCGIILLPVLGWTTHQSIVAADGRWWLFYHDCQLSGDTKLRNVKVTELVHEEDGTIRTIDPFGRSD